MNIPMPTTAAAYAAVTDGCMSHSLTMAYLLSNVLYSPTVSVDAVEGVFPDYDVSVGQPV